MLFQGNYFRTECVWQGVLRKRRVTNACLFEFYPCAQVCTDATLAPKQGCVIFTFHVLCSSCLAWEVRPPMEWLAPKCDLGFANRGPLSPPRSEYWPKSKMSCALSETHLRRPRHGPQSRLLSIDQLPPTTQRLASLDIGIFFFPHVH